MLNRSALIVRPKRPYIDWALSVGNEDGDPILFPDPEDEQTVYLLPTYNDTDQADRMLEKVFSLIFEEQLKSWHQDKTDWPRDRDFEMFKEWFTIEHHSVVLDLCGYNLNEETFQDI